MFKNSYCALSKVYDELMYDVDYDRWADYVASLLPEKCRRVAETACGTGGITFRLCEMGYRVTASDISPEMLNIAAANARAYGLKPNFICQDMCELSLPPQDAVICCCDGVNYLTEPHMLRKFLSAAYSCLKTGGRLLFDISSLHKLRDVLGSNLFFDDSDDVTLLWQNSFDETTRLLQMSLTLFKREGKLYSREDEQQTQRAYDADEVLFMLREAGFENCRALGFLTDRPANDDDERIQFIAEKI